MINLFVGSEQLDLFKNEIFTLTKSIADIGEFGKRNGDKSTSFKVPLTSKNAKIFNSITNFNDVNVASKTNRFTGHIESDSETISNGFFRVMAVNVPKKEIKLSFSGGNANWFSLIKDRYINETYLKNKDSDTSNSYDLGFLSHDYNPNVIASSFSNKDGYVYFPCDNGFNSGKSDNNFTKEDFHVGYYQHTIFNEIFKSLGIKLKGSLFSDPLFYKTILFQPFDYRKIKTVVYSVVKKRFKPTGGKQIDSDSANQGTTPMAFIHNDIDKRWNGNRFDCTSNISQYNWEFRLINLWSQKYSSNDMTLVIKSKVGGTVQPDITTQLTVSNTSVPYYNDPTLSSIYNVETGTFNNLIDGDYIEFFIKKTSFDPNYNVYINHSVEFNNDTYLSYEIVGETREVIPSLTLPKIKQNDFIKDVMIRFAVVSSYDSNSKTLTLNKLNDLETNKINAVDVTDKIDLLKPIDIDYTKLVSKVKKKSIVSYVKDTKDIHAEVYRAALNNDLGDGIITVNNNNLSDVGVIFKSVFASTQQVWTFDTDNTTNFYLPVFSVDEELKPRIMILVNDTLVSEFSSGYSEVLFNSVTYTNLPYSFFAKQRMKNNNGDQTPQTLGLNNNLDTLSFDNFSYSSVNYIGNTLLSKYYGLYIKILNNPFLISLNLKLSSLEVRNIDFNIPIWIDSKYAKGYYYLNEVSQYKGDGSTTKVKLVKI